MPNARFESNSMVPVYNEEATVRKVVLEWFGEMEAWTEDFVFLAIDDGSEDSTKRVLERLRDKRLGPRLMVHSRENRGHGQSCLEGYRMAIQMDAEFVFQIDSDGQCDPKFFYRLWRLRDRNDVIYGVRTWRDDGLLRWTVSMVLRAFILAGFGVFCPDANVPYRLMRVSEIELGLRRLPAKLYLANAAMAVVLAKDRSKRHAYAPIRFRERYAGESSVKPFGFVRRAAEFYRELRPVLSAAEKP